MRRRTTTQQINTAIANNILHITSAARYNKSTHQTELIDTGTFKESLDFLCESMFKDCVGWYYERQTGDIEIECGRMDGSVDVIVSASLRVCDGVGVEDIDGALMMVEEG